MASMSPRSCCRPPCTSPCPDTTVPPLAPQVSHDPAPTHCTPSVSQVSHDQFLIEATVDELWMCENGQVSPFHGTFTEYKQRLRTLNKI